MPEAGEASQAEALKAEGNLLYKNKEYLKARHQWQASAGSCRD